MPSYKIANAKLKIAIAFLTYLAMLKASAYDTKMAPYWPV